MDESWKAKELEEEFKKHIKALKSANECPRMVDLHSAFRSLFAILVPGYFTIDDLVAKFGGAGGQSVALHSIYDAFFAGDQELLKAHLQRRLSMLVGLTTQLRARLGTSIDAMLPNSAAIYNPQVISTMADPDLRKLLLVTQLEFAQKYETLREERVMGSGRVIELKLKASHYANYTYELTFDVVSCASACFRPCVHLTSSPF